MYGSTSRYRSCAQRERPKKIILVDTLAMTATGKIQKAVLRAEFREAYSQP